MTEPTQAGKRKAANRRKYLLLASYCGGEEGCSEQRPCDDCLAMCNVFMVDDWEPSFLRELGPASTSDAETAAKAERDEAVERLRRVREVVALHGGLAPVVESIDELLTKYPEPVDPLLLEARKFAAHPHYSPGNPFGKIDGDDYLAGRHDDGPEVRSYLAALRRGMELKEAQS